jgi:hypothetical protein
MQIDTACSGQFKPFKPSVEVLVTLPQLQHVVWDTMAGAPAGDKPVVAVAKKHVTLMEVPADHDLKAHVRIMPLSGTAVVEDAACDQGVLLHYEVEAKGEVSVTQRGFTKQLNVDFDFHVQCYLSGLRLASSFSGGAKDVADINCSRTPKFGKALPSLDQLMYEESRQDHDNVEVSEIEKRVAAISCLLCTAGGRQVCSVPAFARLMAEKRNALSELAWLKTKAEVLDDMYRVELRSGQEMSKDMLLRLEEVLDSINTVAAIM